jgi:hypothetical protein
LKDERTWSAGCSDFRFRPDPDMQRTAFTQ